MKLNKAAGEKLTEMLIVVLLLTLISQYDIFFILVSPSMRTNYNIFSVGAISHFRFDSEHCFLSPPLWLIHSSYLVAVTNRIIASDFPVIREVLNEENSVLVPSDNFDAWIEAIEKLKDKKEREILAENAYKLFVKKYTWKSRAENIIKIFNDEK